MSDEVTTTVETQPEPSIASAYEEVHGDPTGSKRKPERTESGRNVTLADEESTARELAESGRQRHVVKTQPEVSLADAHAGISTPEAEEFELPDGFSAYSAEDIDAVLGLMGLTEDDLKEPRFAALALKELEASFSPVESEDGEESESEEEATEEETEEDAEKKPEEKSAEKTAALPIPKTVEEYVGNDPQKMEALNKHIEATYQRATSMSEPVMTDVFVRGLASALQTPAENVPMLKEVVDVLQYGGYALVEAAVPKLLPALVDEYMGQRFEAILEHFAPGLKQMHNEAMIANTWADVLEMEEFKDAGLPSWDDKEAFKAASDRVHKDNPWLSEWDNPKVPVAEALRQKAILTAKLLKGETYSPQQRMKAIQQAIETGKKSAQSSNRRVSASRVGRSGKTSGMIGGATEERQSLMSAYNAQHGKDGGIS